MIIRAFTDGQLKSTKSGARRTIEIIEPLAEAVPLDPVAADLLAELGGGDPAGRVFPDLDLKRANHELRAALTRAGVAGAQWRILYDLRHTYASLSILLGVGSATLARRMGNS